MRRHTRASSVEQHHALSERVRASGLRLEGLRLLHESSLLWLHETCLLRLREWLTLAEGLLVLPEWLLTKRRLSLSKGHLTSHLRSQEWRLSHLLLSWHASVASHLRLHESCLLRHHHRLAEGVEWYLLLLLLAREAVNKVSSTKQASESSTHP
jgi:hypothetical protein